MSGSRRSIIGNGIVVVALVVAAVAWFVAQAGLHAPNVDHGRWIAAWLALFAYAALCLHAVVRARRAAAIQATDGDAILIAFATQTGFAEELATSTARALVAAGHRTHVLPLSQVDAASLASTRFALFIVATYGDGEAPDTARRFVRDAMRAPAALGGLRYGLLALGDRTYADFCAFGRALQAWLEAGGARAAFPRVDVDHGADDALAAWQRSLRPWTGDTAADALAAPVFTRWRLVRRALANPGSVGEAAFHVAFEPLAAADLRWQAGDIAIVRLPDGDRREYSIASLPSDGALELLVRCAMRPDGEPGRGAHWLTSALKIGDVADVRIRANHGFRLDGIAPSTPLILVGNGTGIAGLRAHLAQRERDDAHRNWLVFGERNAAHDDCYRDALTAWRRSGHLERVSFAWSRDGERRVHVQDRLREERDAVVAWIAAGAVVLVCGSADGMAGGVDAALRDLVGDAAVDDLLATGRYRRDVY